MRLVKAAKASPHAKFYSLSTEYSHDGGGRSFGDLLAADTETQRKEVKSYVLDLSDTNRSE